MFSRFRKNKDNPIYHFNGKVVWVVWLFPDGFEKAPQLHGLYSSEKKALRAIDNDPETFNRVPFKVESFTVDFRLTQPVVKYWKGNINGLERKRQR